MGKSSLHFKRFAALSHKLAPDTYGLDLPSRVEKRVDQARMAATCVLSTPDIDRLGDIVNMAGINTSRHRLLPNVLWNHHDELPTDILGKTLDPDGNYTVEIFEDVAVQTTFFNQSNPLAEQVFNDIVKGYIGANSIGYKPTKRNKLKTGGYYLEEIDLVEVSWVISPANPFATVACLTDSFQEALARTKVCGRPLDKRLEVAYRKGLHLLHRTSGGFRAKSSVVVPRSIGAGVALMATENKMLTADTKTAPETPVETPQEEAAETQDTSPESKGYMNGERLPHGAACAHNYHDWLYYLCQSIESELPSIENEADKAHFQQVCEGAMLLLGSMEDYYASRWADQDQLARVGTRASGDSGEETPAETEAGGGEGADGAGEKADVEVAAKTVEAAAGSDESGEKGFLATITKQLNDLNAGQQLLAKSITDTLAKFLKPAGDDTPTEEDEVGDIDIKAILAEMPPDEVDALLDEVADELLAAQTPEEIHAGRRRASLGL